MAMDQQQRPHNHWALKVGIGEQQRLAARANESIWITDVFLVDPASAAGQGAVDACFGQGDVLASLWAERPREKLSPPVALHQELPLYVTLQGGGSSAGGRAVVVQFEGYFVRNGNNIGEGEEEAPLQMAFPGRLRRRLRELWSNFSSWESILTTRDINQEEQEEEEEEEEEDTIDEWGEEESDGDMAIVCYMRVADVETNQKGSKCIRVVYRYTHFSAASDGGVQPVRETTKVHNIRFMVSPAADTVRSLRWVNASLAGLVFPSHCRKALQGLWSKVVSHSATKDDIPAGAMGFTLAVAVGVFRTADCTFEVKRSVLEDITREPLPRCHDSMELDLPEPAPCGAGEEDCPVCWEPMMEGDDLLAWQGCDKPHVFHGQCLEAVLGKSDTCPLCRRVWYIQPKRLLHAKYDIILSLLVANKTFLGTFLFVCMVIAFFRWIMYS